MDTPQSVKAGVGGEGMGDICYSVNKNKKREVPCYFMGHMEGYVLVYDRNPGSRLNLPCCLFLYVKLYWKAVTHACLHFLSG